MKARALSMLRVISAPRASDRASVRVYRPFFLAGMFCVLTVGCLLGALALFGIGQSGTYANVRWMPFILAHANSQMYGWVGFFVMGFALQQHAPTVARAGLFHRLAWASLGMAAAGIALRFAAEPMILVNRDVWLPVGIFSGLLQTAAVAAFVFNTSYTRHRGSGGITWPTWFVFGSLFWLVVVAAAEPVVFSFSHQADAAASAAFIAQWSPALREAQFLGFVAMMIFGVSLVKLNSCFGARQAHAGLGRAGFVLWTAGLLMRMAGWMTAWVHGFAAGSQSLYFGSGIVLALAAACLVGSSRIFEPLSERFRSHKFVRAAFAWLLIAGFLMIAEPLHLRQLNAPFSHAFTGAVRHAVTVGFISQMILGFGAHVAARMNDLDERRLAPLWTAFVLLNLGNAARVGLEIMSDLSPSAFVPMGLTGFVELAGITIWAVHVAGPMLARSTPRLAHAE